jgi:agmatinase
MKTKTVIAGALVSLILGSMTGLAQEGSTRNDPSVTPWNDPDDPYVIRLNRDDPSTTSWNYRNSRLAEDRKGPTDLNRYGGGARHEAFPTFLGAPVALTPQELKDGDIDVAIVGALTDMNAVPGTALGANMLRAVPISSADYFTAKGDGRQEANPDVFPVDTYLRTSLGEINLVDYGNIKRHPYSGEKSTEEIRAVLGEIYEGGALPMLVGGSHDNMIGLFLAAADKVGRGNFGVIHFDSHADTIPTGYGYYIHNGNGIYMGSKLGLFERKDIIQIGLTSVGPNDELFKWQQEGGVKTHFQAEIEHDGWDKVMERVLAESARFENVVVTVDIDIMASAYVPGTGGRQPDGPTPSQMMKAMRQLAIAGNVVAIEISEYNPLLDSRSHQTANVVNHLMSSFLHGLIAKERGITDPNYYHPKALDHGFGPN